MNNSNKLKYATAVGTAQRYLANNQFDDVLECLSPWKNKEDDKGAELIMDALLRSKRYDVAVIEGARLQHLDIKLQCYIALNAAGRHAEALQFAKANALAWAAPWELTYLGSVEEATQKYCAAIKAGYKPSVRDLQDPDLSPIWEFVATSQELPFVVADVFSELFWDEVIEDATTKPIITLCGHAVVASEPLDVWDYFEWDNGLNDFIASEAYIARYPDKSKEVENRLTSRLRQNVERLSKIVEFARQELAYWLVAISEHKELQYTTSPLDEIKKYYELRGFKYKEDELGLTVGIETNQHLIWVICSGEVGGMFELRVVLRFEAAIKTVELEEYIHRLAMRFGPIFVLTDTSILLLLTVEPSMGTITVRTYNTMFRYAVGLAEEIAFNLHKYEK